ncbi:MAG: hypothetical protein EBS27_00835 [Actinobacteria bacterium]|nr:hypothetical protein [Actinomycetota bacterium]
MTNYSDATTLNEPPRGHARIVYLGPASPHWEVYGDYGDQNMLEEFRARTLSPHHLNRFYSGHFGATQDVAEMKFK